MISFSFHIFSSESFLTVAIESSSDRPHSNHSSVIHHLSAPVTRNRVPHLIVEVGLVSLIGIILIIVAIVLIVHFLGRPARMPLSPLTVIFIQALGLSQFVDFSTGKSGEQFFGECMRNGLACS